MKRFVIFLFALFFASGLLSAQIDTVHLRLPDGLDKRGNISAYPIFLDDSLVTADSILSGEFTVAHNGTVIDILGIDTVGTVLGGKQTVLYNAVTKKIAFAHATPITGKGVLIYLTIQIKSGASGTSVVTLTGAMFNEGDPITAVDAGSIRPKDIFINPKNPPQNKVVGDTTFFSVNGDVMFPVSWSVSDTAVAKITATGAVIGKKVGQVNVMVVDAQGLSDQSTLLPINAPGLGNLTVTVRDTSIMQNLTFDLPIYVSNVTSLGILSAQWKLNFNANTLVPKAVIQAGTIAQGWGPPVVNMTSNSITVAMAGTDTITGQGVLAYVRFQVKRFANQSSNLDLQNVMFNETIFANVDNGFFSPIPGPTIIINPNVPVLTKGDTLTFSASGGTAPYKWYSSAPASASVDSLTGKVTALSRGTVDLSAIDAQGFDGHFSLTVNDFLATLPDTIIRVGDSVDVPITVTNVNGLGILSKQIKISYDTTKVRFGALLPAGTMSNGMLTAVKDSAAVIRMAFSGTNPLSGSGVFAKLRFYHKAPSGTGQFSPLTFTEYQVNEPGPAQPTATLKNGKLTIANALNVSPVFTKVMGDTTINEDQQLNFDYDAVDGNSDPVRFSLLTPPAGMAIDSITGILSWRPTFTQSGNYNFTVRASDGKGGITSRPTAVTVQNVNRNPVFTRLMGDTTIMELQNLTFDYNGADPDNNPITFGLQGQITGMAIDSITGIFTFTPTATQAGIYNFQVRIFDGQGGFVNDAVQLTVLNNNRSPVFTRMMGDTTILEQQNLTFDYNASDADGDVVRFGMTGMVQGMAIDSNTGVFTFTPTSTQSGVYNLTVRAYDGIGGIVTDPVVITVTDQNRPPVFTALMGDTSIAENQALVYDYNAIDPDGNTVRFGLTNPATGMSIDSVTGVFRFTPTFTQFGTYNFTVRAYDNLGGVVTDAVVLNVSNVNRPPFFTQSMADTLFGEASQTFNGTYAGSDPDNDNVTITSVEMPAGATFSASQFSWTPTPDQRGTHRAIFRASDGSLSVNDTTVFIISNTAPVFTQRMNDTTIAEGQTLNFTFAATDPENDPLSFVIVGQSPQGLTLSSAGALNWTPNFFQSGSYTIIVRLVEKQFSFLDTAIITVTNTNRPPVFTAAPSDYLTYVDTVNTFAYTASDPDGENLTFSLIAGPSNAVVQSSGALSWTPQAAHLGQNLFVVGVSDGIVTVRDSAVITVTGFPKVSVSDTVFNFGSVTFGVLDTLRTVVRNDGVVPLTFRALPQFNLPSDPNFILDTAGTSTILPGESKTISIVYAAKSVGGHFTPYVFVTNDFRKPSYTFLANGSSIAKLLITKKVLVDVTHNSTAPLTDTANGMGELFQFLGKSGIQITYSTSPLNPSGFDILLLVTPQTNYTQLEIDSIRSFVQSGGLLIALGNSSAEGNNNALNALLTNSGWTTNLSLRNDMVVDSTAVDSTFKNANTPFLTSFADAEHPYFTGVDTLLFFRSASVRATEPAIPFITTKDSGRTIGDSLFFKPAVAGLSTVGDGKILLMGDADAWRADSSTKPLAPNITYRDNLAFVLNILSITENYQVKLAAKTPSERYQLVSIPYDLENGQISSVLKNLGEPNPLVWRLFGRYDPVTNKYAEFPSSQFNSFRRGEAYWLITRGQFDLTPGSATVVPVQSYYPIKIGPGYSIIGNPFPYPISWEHSIRDSVQSVIWGFNGTTFKAESLAMQPFQGYFVKNLSADSVTIFINPGDISSEKFGKSSTPALSLKNGEWRIGIAASSGRAADEENYAGVMNGAKAEFDRSDVAEPPASPTEYLVVRFVNKHWNKHAGYYAVDLRESNDDGMFWDLEVIAARTKATVDLSADLLGQLPPGFSAYLIDKTAERAIRIDPNYHYQFTMLKNESRRSFRLIAGRTEFIEKNTQGIPLVAMDYALAQNFPNPFNPSTQIRYVLGHSGAVTLEVFNVLGQRVRTLRNEFQPIGTYSAEWDGTNDSGRRMASGVYFYSVRVISNGESVFQQTKKMVLLK